MGREQGAALSSMPQEETGDKESSLYHGSLLTGQIQYHTEVIIGLDTIKVMDVLDTTFDCYFNDIN